LPESLFSIFFQVHAASTTNTLNPLLVYRNLNQKNNKILDNFFCKLKLINLLAKGLCQSRVLKLALDKEL